MPHRSHTLDPVPLPPGSATSRGTRVARLATRVLPWGRRLDVWPRLVLMVTLPLLVGGVLGYEAVRERLREISEVTQARSAFAVAELADALMAELQLERARSIAVLESGRSNDVEALAVQRRRGDDALARLQQAVASWRDPSAPAGVPEFPDAPMPGHVAPPAPRGAADFEDAWLELQALPGYRAVVDRRLASPLHALEFFAAIETVLLRAQTVALGAIGDAAASNDVHAYAMLAHAREFAELEDVLGDPEALRAGREPHAYERLVAVVGARRGYEQLARALGGTALRDLYGPGTALEAEPPAFAPTSRLRGPDGAASRARDADAWRTRVRGRMALIAAAQASLHERVVAHFDRQAARARRGAAFVIGASLIAGILSLLLAATVARGIARMVRQAIEAAERLEAGDLSRDVPTDGTSDPLARALNRVIDGLRRITAQVEQVAIGDLQASARPRSDRDALGRAFERMTEALRAADAENRRAHGRITALFDAAPVAMLMVDGDGRIVMANGYADRIFGHAPGGLVDTELDALVPERARGIHPANRARVMGDPGTARRLGGERDLAAVRRDGSEFPCEIGLTAIEIDGERYAIASVVDLSHRQQIHRLQREKLAQLETAFVLAAGGVLAVDASGHIVRANPSASEIIGLPVPFLENATLHGLDEWLAGRAGAPIPSLAAGFASAASAGMGLRMSLSEGRPGEYEVDVRRGRAGDGVVYFRKVSAAPAAALTVA